MIKFFFYAFRLFTTNFHWFFIFIYYISFNNALIHFCSLLKLLNNHVRWNKKQNDTTHDLIPLTVSTTLKREASLVRDCGYQWSRDFVKIKIFSSVYAALLTNFFIYPIHYKILKKNILQLKTEENSKLKLTKLMVLFNRRYSYITQKILSYF